MMRELHVDSPRQLEELCQSIRDSDWLALDTEFMREKTYYPQLCLLQLSNGSLAASIDSLQLETLDPLLEVIFDPAITKIFHAGRQDLEIFHHRWGRLPSPLFDTQPAAALLGLGDQTGYANLVQNVLGRELEKGQTRTDWSRRPLSEAQLRYALDDVIYLGQLYLELKKRLSSQDRLAWLEPDFELLAAPSTYEIAAEDAWKRIRGRQRLRGSQLAVLQALAAWRETLAKESDRPRRWILKDEVALELARRRPTQTTQMERIRGLDQGVLKRHGKELLRLIGEASALPASGWPVDSDSPTAIPNPNQEAMVDLLAASLRLVAEKNRITPSALAGRRDLERLALGERDMDLLQGWRGALVGEALLAVLHGRAAVQIKDGQVCLVSSTP